jgi:hypothetical protein
MSKNPADQGEVCDVGDLQLGSDDQRRHRPDSPDFQGSSSYSVLARQKGPKREDLSSRRGNLAFNVEFEGHMYRGSVSRFPMAGSLNFSWM